MKKYLRSSTSYPVVDTANRRAGFVLSTSGVKRDGYTIAQPGWILAPFNANPVALFCHASDTPPIGRWHDVGVVNNELRGTLEFTDADTYEFGDTIYRLVKAGFLNMTSVAWNPIRWVYSKDKSRPGGIDFLEQELLECSIVPVGADPQALCTARAAGIDTRPIVQWAEQVLDTGGRVSLPRAELEALRRAARMPAAPRRNSLRTFAKLNARADREKFLRLMVFEDARKGIAAVPPCMLPCRTRAEREAIVAYYRKTQAAAALTLTTARLSAPKAAGDGRASTRAQREASAAELSRPIRKM